MEKVVSSPSKSIELGRVQHVAAFSDGDVGGNGAGVYLSDEMPAEDDMGALAADLGYSETAFVVPSGEAFRVRYFSPESEVPFCGHATIALGAVLAAERGAGTFSLELNDATISVEASTEDGISVIALQSPPTHSEPARSELAREVSSKIRRLELPPQRSLGICETWAGHTLAISPSFKARTWGNDRCYVPSSRTIQAHRFVSRGPHGQSGERPLTWMRC